MKVQNSKIQNVTVHIGGKAEVNRYCHGCGKLVKFIDSGIKRRNANGKNIFEFAIYKCERDHTWNKKLTGYKANAMVVKDDKEKNDIHEVKPITIKDIIHLERYDIIVSGIVNDLRIDKFLGMYLSDLSRTIIQGYIEDELIKVNENKAKISYKLRDDDIITLFINKISTTNYV